MKPDPWYVTFFCLIVAGVSIVAFIVLWQYLSSHGCQLTAHC